MAKKRVDFSALSTNSVLDVLNSDHIVMRTMYQQLVNLGTMISARLLQIQATRQTVPRKQMNLK